MKQETLQNLLFKAFSSIGKDDDGEFRIPFEPDKDCPYNVVVYVKLTDGLLRVYGMCSNFINISNQDIVQKLLLINKWNSAKYFPKGYAINTKENGWYIQVEECLCINDKEFNLPDEYVITFIKLIASGIWKFFVTMHKGAIEDNNN